MFRLPHNLHASLPSHLIACIMEHFVREIWRMFEFRPRHHTPNAQDRHAQ
jgi:hypothetical protein